MIIQSNIVIQEQEKKYEAQDEEQESGTAAIL